MTLIIGARFKDGVILISDRKVTESETGNYFYDRKLITPLPIPLVLSASGYSHKFKQFHRQMVEKIDERQREIKLKNIAYYKSLNLKYIEPKEEKIEPKKLNTDEFQKEKTHTNRKKPSENTYIYSTEMFLQDCCRIAKNLCTDEDNGIIRPDLNMLLAIHANGARLHHIDFYGQEHEMPYYCIGSGSSFAELFLKKFWSESMSIQQIITLGFFCIYYVQELGLDNCVGVENTVFPDYLVITHDGQTAVWKELENENKRIEILNDIYDKTNKFKGIIQNLTF